MQTLWTKALWKSPSHSAFTDLCAFKQQLFCCFREALNHISNDGKILILGCDKTGEVISKARLQIANCDLRDPKLSVMPDGKLLLIAYARKHSEEGQWHYSRPVCWFSSDGHSWSSQHFFADQNWWLWRLRWSGDEAYGFAYNRAQQALSLYKGNPLRTFQVHKQDALALHSHQLGYPNESDICFSEDANRAYAIVRRDADSCTAQLGVANRPFKQWKWFDLHAYVASPVMHLLNAQHAIVCGRVWRNNQPKTAILSLDIANKKLKLEHELVSSGDNSYPGIVVTDDGLYLSYYSSHEDDRSDIYLCKIKL